MDRLRQDLIVSLRRLQKTPGFTIAAIVTLALGIGVNTTIFTAINTILFHPLPGVERPEELSAINMRLKHLEVPAISFPNYVDFRDRNNVFSGLTVYEPARISFSRGDGNNALMWGYLVTGNYFETLGAKPARGRLLGLEDDRAKMGEPFAVISYGCWERRFGSSPDVVGSTIKLNGLAYTIVGVATPGFVGTESIFVPDIWVPMAMQMQIEPGEDVTKARGNANTFAIGRLKPAVTRPQAEAAMNSIAGDLGREYPEQNEGIQIVLSPPGLFGTYFRGTTEAFAAILLALAGMVLLIACVNLAGLLLARAADRRKEIATRIALGAARGQLVRQLMTESLVLSIVGGAAGVLLAIWLTNMFALWHPMLDLPLMPKLSVDAEVLVFAGVASLLTGLLFGLVPALQSTRSSLTAALKNETAVEGLRRFQLRDLLVTAQVALSVTLLVGAVLVIRSLERAMTVPLGFEPQHAASVSVDLALQGYDPTRGREFQRQLIEKVRALPGIQAAGLTTGLPLTIEINNNGINIEGKPTPKAADTPLAAAYRAGPGYFHAMETKFIAGRDFDERDTPTSKRVAIVNQAFAHQLLPNEDPLGKRFRSGMQGPWVEIVGVVEDGKYRSIGEHPRPAVFESMQGWTPHITVVARSALPESEVVDLLRRSVLELDPSIAIFQAGSLADQLGFALLPARIAASVLGAFGLLAVVLAATGVYGILAYAVARRTREIGIRMALGASSGQVMRAVLARAAVLLAAGTGIGMALALAGGRFISQILYGVSPEDPVTYALALGLMAVMALGASWFPARRAIGIDPVRALRLE